MNYLVVKGSDGWDTREHTENMTASEGKRVAGQRRNTAACICSYTWCLNVSNKAAPVKSQGRSYGHTQPTAAARLHCNWKCLDICWTGSTWGKQHSHWELWHLLGSKNPQRVNNSRHPKLRASAKCSLQAEAGFPRQAVLHCSACQPRGVPVTPAASTSVYL